jgi:mannose PTS system EIIA component
MASSDSPATVGILLVTHGKVGHVLLETLREMMPLPLRADVLEVRRVQSHDILLSQGCKMIERLDAGVGVLLLTDAYGATPSNIAYKLGDTHSLPVVSGLNLPMLVRVFNYPQQSLAELTQTAVDGGKRGVFHCNEIVH